MSEKRFEVVLNEFDEVEYIMDKKLCEDKDFAEFMNFVEILAKENEQLKEENEYLKKRIEVISDELYCKDRKLEELGVPIECCDKMSEKRFVSFYGYAVEDKATAKKYSSDNIEELVDLINELHDCYIKQGKMIFKLEEDLQYYKTKSARVEEELLSTSVLNECKYCLKERRNVQKFRFKNMKEVDDYLEKQINFDDDNFINSLNEENEQLKEENKYLKKRIEVISDELYCKDRKLEELGVHIECCDNDE